MVSPSQFTGLFEIARNGVQSIPFKIRFAQSCFCALELRVLSEPCCCAAAWGCGLVPAPGDSPHPPTSHLAAKWRQLARGWWAAWVATFPPYQRELGRGMSSNAEITKSFIPHHERH